MCWRRFKVQRLRIELAGTVLLHITFSLHSVQSITLALQNWQGPWPPEAEDFGSAAARVSSHLASALHCSKGHSNRCHAREMVLDICEEVSKH